MKKNHGKKDTVKGKSEGEVPKTNVPGAAKEGEKKEKNLIVGITRGRMPIAIVSMVRYGDQKNLDTKALATLFGTTVGKINDIKTSSTFGYVDAKFKPTQVQKDDGITWLRRHVDFKKGTVDVLISELEATKVASEKETAAFEEVRIAARGQRTTTKTGEPANAGGGNRQKKPIKTKDREPTTKDSTTKVDSPSGKELLD